MWKNSRCKNLMFLCRIIPSILQVFCSFSWSVKTSAEKPINLKVAFRKKLSKQQQRNSSKSFGALGMWQTFGLRFHALWITWPHCLSRSQYRAGLCSSSPFSVHRTVSRFICVPYKLLPAIVTNKKHFNSKKVLFLLFQVFFRNCRLGKKLSMRKKDHWELLCRIIHAFLSRGMLTFKRI